MNRSAERKDWNFLMDFNLALRCELKASMMLLVRGHHGMDWYWNNSVERLTMSTSTVCTTRLC